MSLRLLLLLVLALPLWPQGSVTLFGTVTDSTGAAVPDASVVITPTETGAVRSTTTSARGDFVASQLPVGTYRVRIEGCPTRS